jgi:hypothetical protein
MPRTTPRSRSSRPAPAEPATLSAWKARVRERLGKPIPVELRERELKRLFIIGTTADKAAEIARAYQYNSKIAPTLRGKSR